MEGSIQGQGKLFYSNNKVKYTGNFIDGEENGFGQLFTEDGLLIYEGEFEAGTVYTI